MLDRYLVTHCSPTLAGLKSANLFYYQFKTKRDLTQSLTEWSLLFAPKGVSIRLLCVSGDKGLIYVYRSQKVQKELRQKGAFNFLSNYGYETDQLDLCLQHLSKRIYFHSEFPHEIGLFLGYPLADIIGFVENKGKHCFCSGCWKVYCDQESATKTFKKFNKCKCIYMNLYKSGKSVLDLTIVA